MRLNLILSILLFALLVCGCSDPAAESPDIPLSADADPDADSAVDAAEDSPGPQTGETGSMDSADEGPTLLEVADDPHCENLNPRYCPLPWPSDRWLTEDPETLTGYRLEYDSKGMPATVSGLELDATPFTRLDGFSPSSQMLTLFEAPANLDGVATQYTIEASLKPDHATVILDLETGDRVAHWVENDARADSEEETILFLHPANRLLPNRSYAVAIRGLSAVDGTPLSTSAGFAALRDGVPTSSVRIEARRDGFEALFDQLEQAGIERASLQAAWRFHTASNHAIRRDLLTIRADALERLGAEGIGCTVESVEEDFEGTTARRIRGTITVPWYLDAAKPPAALVRDEDGAPIYVTTEPIGFTAIVPGSLLSGDTPGPLITWGHGLFGEAEGTISSKSVLEVAEQAGMVIVATDWHGMSEKDLGFLATALTNVSNFYMVGENLQQGMVIQIALTRTMLGVCSDIPELLADAGHPVIDLGKSYYLGGSQGSILGGTLLTVSPDIERGALIVGGATFSFMIERSIHFNLFGPLLTPSYGSRLATALLMALSQHVWDGAETAGWLGAAVEGLESIGPRRFLYLIAENDSQVCNLSSDLAARLSGIPVLDSSVRKPWGVPVVAGPIDGSAYVSMDFGDPPNDDGNVSPAEDFGGHGGVAFTPEGTAMILHFLKTGQIIDTCDGYCDVSQ